jgi:hypothetical protein
LLSVPTFLLDVEHVLFHRPVEIQEFVVIHVIMARYGQVVHGSHANFVLRTPISLLAALTQAVQLATMGEVLSVYGVVGLVVIVVLVVYVLVKQLVVVQHQVVVILPV